MFNLFIKKRIIISPKKSFFGFLNIKLFNFKINALGLFNIKNCIDVFKRFYFPTNFKALE